MPDVSISEQRIQTIEADRRKARSVLYLEGNSDVDIFFAAIGKQAPAGGFLNDVLVRGLSDSDGGSGSKAVKQLVMLANELRISNVFGLVDGDGESKGDLANGSSGLFRLPVYCAENLLFVRHPKVRSFVPDFDLSRTLKLLAPYAAMSELNRAERTKLREVGLIKLLQPNHSKPLYSNSMMLARLKRIDGSSLGKRYQQHYAKVLESLDGMSPFTTSAHRKINGKWILGMAKLALPADARMTLILALCDSGGVPVIRKFWTSKCANI